MLDWIADNQTALWVLAAGAGAITLASFILLPWMLVRMPSDYFARDKRPPRKGKSPLGLTLLRVGKNLLAVAFVVAGLLLLFLPGPGFLAIVVGAFMLNFPGKHRLIGKIFARPTLIDPINRLRRRAGQPPLVLST